MILQYTNGSKRYWRNICNILILLSFITLLLNPSLDYRIIHAEPSLENSGNGNQTTFPDSITATAVSRCTININWTNTKKVDATWIEYANFNDMNWSRGTHHHIDTTSNDTLNHSGLSPGITYFYKAWFWNETENLWSNGTKTNETTQQNSPPTVHIIQPVNGSINQSLSVDFRIYLNDLDNDSFQWSIECSNGQRLSGTASSNITQQMLIVNLDYNTTYLVWVNITDGYDKVCNDYSFTTRNMFIPCPPGSSGANAIETDTIEVNWTSSYGLDYTYIEWNIIPNWNRTEGLYLFNDTKTTTIHKGLNPHTTYYYKLWGWNETDGKYSPDCTTIHETTKNTPPDIGTPSPENTTSLPQPLSFTWRVNIHDDDSDLFQWSIKCTNGQSIERVNDSSGIKELDVSGLKYNTQYTVLVTVSDGYDSRSEWFVFSTISDNKPPVIHQIYPENQSSINIDDCSNISVNISDPNGDDIHWLISTSPSIGNSSNVSKNDTIYCSLSDVKVGQEYIWNLTLYDGYNWINQSFSFTTIKESSEGQDKGGFSDGGIASENSYDADLNIADAGGPYDGLVDTPLHVDGELSYANEQNITGFRWDFNDDGIWDTSWRNYSNASVTYGSSGNYTIRLEVTDGSMTDIGLTYAYIVQYNNPPSLLVVKDPDPSIVLNESWNVTVKISDVDNDNIRLQINWGDSIDEWSDYYQPGQTITLHHQWNSEGIKTVKALVKDERNAVSQWYTIGIVSVRHDEELYDESESTVIFTKTTGVCDEPLSFHAYQDGFIPTSVHVVSVSWNFGDNETGSGVQVDHTYSEPGEYIISCIYITDDGQIHTTEQSITIAKGNILAGFLKSISVSWITLFLIMIVCSLLFYLIVIKKYDISGLIEKIRFISSRFYAKLKKKFYHGKKNDYDQKHHMNTIYPSTSDEGIQESYLSDDKEWDSFLFKPITIAGVFYELEEKKRYEQNVRDTVDDILYPKHNSMNPSFESNKLDHSLKDKVKN